MSRVNFDALVSEHPESARGLRILEKWMRKHMNERVLNPQTLAREIKAVDAVELATALTLLTKEGILRRVYKVTTPSGVLSDAEFEDPREIPNQLPDRFERYFDTAESDVIPIFQRVA
jgi:hypothetical protein